MSTIPVLEKEAKALRRYIGLSKKRVLGLRRIKDKKTGNGWTPSRLPQRTFSFRPISPDLAVNICERKKVELFGFALFKPRRFQVDVLSGALEFRPFWNVAGRYHCFYLRNNSYTVPVSADTLYVILEEKMRNLVRKEEAKEGQNLFQVKEDQAVPEELAKILDEVQRFLSFDERYFVAEQALELAHIWDEGELYLDGQGALSQEFEGIMKEFPSEAKEVSRPEEVASMFSPRDVDREGIQVKPLEKPTVDTNSVVEVLRNKIEQKPSEPHLNIVETRFDVLGCSLYYVPYYVFETEYLKDHTRKTLELNGVTREIREIAKKVKKIEGP